MYEGGTEVAMRASAGPTSVDDDPLGRGQLGRRRGVEAGQPHLGRLVKLFVAVGQHLAGGAGGHHPPSGTFLARA